MVETRQTGTKKRTRQPVGQRTSNRFQIPSCQVNLARAGIIVKLLGKKEYKASLVNLSKSGIQIVTQEALRPDEEYSISLFVPGKLDARNIKAKVVWTCFYKKVINNDYYRTGFMFTKITPDAKSGLKQLEARFC